MESLAAGQSFRAAIAALAVLLIASPVHAGILDGTWNAPTTTVGGSRLTNLAAYRVYYGTSKPPCPTSTFAVVPSTTSAPAPGTVVRFTRQFHLTVPTASRCLHVRTVPTF